MEIRAGCSRGLTSIFCTTSWRSSSLFWSCRFSSTSFSFLNSANKIIFFKAVITFDSKIIKKNFELLHSEAINIIWYFDIRISTRTWSFACRLAGSSRLLFSVCAVLSLELFICFQTLAILHSIFLDISIILCSLCWIIEHLECFIDHLEKLIGSSFIWMSW